MGCLLSLQLLLRTALGRDLAVCVQLSKGPCNAACSSLRKGPCKAVSFSSYWGLWDFCFVFLPESEHPHNPPGGGCFNWEERATHLLKAMWSKAQKFRSHRHVPLRGVHQLSSCYAVRELVALLRLKHLSPPNFQTHSCSGTPLLWDTQCRSSQQVSLNSLYLWGVLFFSHGLWEFWQKLIRSLDLLATLSLKSLPSRQVLVDPSHFAVYTSVSLFIFLPHPHCQLHVTQIVERTRHFQPTISRYIR